MKLDIDLKRKSGKRNPDQGAGFLVLAFVLFFHPVKSFDNSAVSFSQEFYPPAQKTAAYGRG
jgi:hypothetical protein